ncbi:MAG: hypothetical protein LBU32_28760 [Clostridiales bacterium]|nr:hypothetical protein [Clostridiales bacterium]
MPERIRTFGFVASLNVGSSLLKSRYSWDERRRFGRGKPDAALICAFAGAVMNEEQPGKNQGLKTMLLESQNA